LQVGVVGPAVLRDSAVRQSALGQADEMGHGHRCPLVLQLDGERPAGRDETGVDAIRHLLHRPEQDGGDQ